MIKILVIIRRILMSILKLWFFLDNRTAKFLQKIQHLTKLYIRNLNSRFLIKLKQPTLID